ncbi:septum site-determining protein MinC [Desulforhopalus sp. 52FAK]
MSENFRVDVCKVENISESKQSNREEVAAIRGRMVSLTVLELYSADLEEIDRQLKEKVEKAPAFFQNAPILLDFENFSEDIDPVWFDKAWKLLSESTFSPVGITGGDGALEVTAKARNIAIWPSIGRVGAQTTVEESVAVPTPTPEPASAPVPATLPPTTQVVRQPVRSGQRIHAQGGDLIVLASVSTGAEILADGHIHVYGTLRGRALAGVQGDENARIFCQDLQADLVAIAGFYTINEDLPADKHKKAVQIFLDKEDLRIETI